MISCFYTSLLLITWSHALLVLLDPTRAIYLIIHNTSLGDGCVRAVSPISFVVLPWLKSMSNGKVGKRDPPDTVSSLCCPLFLREFSNSSGREDQKDHLVCSIILQ